jgi:hypothetical protein
MIAGSAWAGARAGHFLAQLLLRAWGCQ